MPVQLLSKSTASLVALFSAVPLYTFLLAPLYAYLRKAINERAAVTGTAAKKEQPKKSAKASAKQLFPSRGEVLVDAPAQNTATAPTPCSTSTNAAYVQMFSSNGNVVGWNMAESDNNDLFPYGLEAFGIDAPPMVSHRSGSSASEESVSWPSSSYSEPMIISPNHNFNPVAPAAPPVMVHGVYPMPHSIPDSDDASPVHIIDKQALPEDLFLPDMVNAAIDYMPGSQQFLPQFPNAVDLLSPESSSSAYSPEVANMSRTAPSTAQIRSTSPSKSDEFVCDHCDASFKVKGYLTRHIKKHAKTKAYTCPFFDPAAETPCHPTGGFSRRDTYKTHLKSRHFKYPAGTRSAVRKDTPGKCGGCGHSFASNELWVKDHVGTRECPAVVDTLDNLADIMASEHSSSEEAESASFDDWRASEFMAQSQNDMFYMSHPLAQTQQQQQQPMFIKQEYRMPGMV